MAHAHDPIDPIFVPVIFGNDLSTYAIAQLIHRRWGYPSYTLSEAGRGPINHSRILRPIHLGEIPADQPVYPAYLQAINRIAREHHDYPIFVIGNTDGFIAALEQAGSRAELEPNVIPAVGPAPEIYHAADKAHLARALSALGLPVLHEVTLECADVAPEQSIAAEVCDAWRAQLKGIEFPAVMKSADGGTSFAALRFAGKKKVYLARDCDHALEIMEQVSRGGYRGKMLAQELVSGDETYSWVISGYIDSRGNATMGASAQVIVNLHQASLLGNAAGLITTRRDDLIKEGTALVRELGVRGSFTIDMKIDARTGKHYFLDVNTRIGRSCYHLWAAGINPLEMIVADVIENREIAPQFNSREAVYSIIPSALLLRYATGGDLRTRVLKAMAKGQVYHPLTYWRDVSPYRLAYRQAQALNYGRKLLADYPQQSETGF